jgi:hypothetical protein
MMMSFCWQDCVVILAPYPNNPNPVESFNIKTDFDIQGNGLVWYARGAAKRPALGLPAAVQNEPTFYDIIYDIMI